MSVCNKNTRRVLSYDVLRQQKTGVMTKGVVSGGFWHPLRRIASSPSQTLRRRLVRTTDDGRRGVLDARRRPSRLCFSQFATRTNDNTVDLYAAKPDIRPESRFLPTTSAFDAPVRGVPVGLAPPRLVRKKLEWCGYPMVKKIRSYLYSFWRNSRMWQTHTRTDRQTPHDGIGRAYA